MGRRRRNLHPDERDLWNRVARTAKPLHPRKAETANEPPERKTETAPLPRVDLSKFRIGGAAAEASRPTAPTPNTRRLGMDAKAYSRLKRGKLDVERRLDLHGLALAEAHARLTSFILSSHARGLRLVLVITGKGRDHEETDPLPGHRGILRRQVPHWLGSPPLRNAILEVTDAHRRHGGSGALYVYLRRK